MMYYWKFQMSNVGNFKSNQPPITQSQLKDSAHFAVMESIKFIQKMLKKIMEVCSKVKQCHDLCELYLKKERQKYKAQKKQKKTETQSPSEPYFKGSSEIGEMEDIDVYFNSDFNVNGQKKLLKEEGEESENQSKKGKRKSERKIKRDKKSVKRPPKVLKKPLNAFMLFLRANLSDVQSNNPNIRSTNLPKILANLWRQADEKTKNKFKTQYQENKNGYFEKKNELLRMENSEMEEQSLMHQILEMNNNNKTNED